MATVKEIDAFFGNAFSENAVMHGDNDGIMVLYDESIQVKRALITLDVTSEAIFEAKRLGAELIIAHHPLIFRPLSRISASDSVGKRVVNAIKCGISVLSYHTRLDTDDMGVSTMLAETLGISRAVPYADGFGRIGTLETETAFDTFVEQAKIALGTDNVTYVKSKPTVKTVAVVGGSGREFMEEAISLGADTFLTGEVRHDSMIDAKEYGLNLIIGTHYATENVVLPAIEKMLAERFPEIETATFESNVN